MRLESRPGAGTTISLYLPRHGGGTARSAAKTRDSVPPGRSETILVVEDNAEVAEAACELISALGYRTLCAPDAEGALKLLGGATQIDLVFSDVGLPGGMSGVELGREARRRRPGSRVLPDLGLRAGPSGRRRARGVSAARKTLPPRRARHAPPPRPRRAGLGHRLINRIQMRAATSLTMAR